MANQEWLATGGAFYLLWIVWFGSAIGFAIGGLRAGKASNSENDGCLLAICNVILAFVGGGVGFLVLMHNFPAFVVSSMLGSLALPAMNTSYFFKKSRR